MKTNDRLWILISFMLVGTIVGVMFSKLITPFLNYIIWGIDTH